MPLVKVSDSQMVTLVVLKFFEKMGIPTFNHLKQPLRSASSEFRGSHRKTPRPGLPTLGIPFFNFPIKGVIYQEGTTGSER